MRVTEPAQRAVTFAKQEAGRLGHDRVGTEHMLLGLLDDEQCLAVTILGGLGIAPEPLRRRVEETVGQGSAEPGMGFQLPTTKAFTLVLSLATRETSRAAPRRAEAPRCSYTRPPCHSISSTSRSQSPCTRLHSQDLGASRRCCRAASRSRTVMH
jgi:ATP-dependent Clp protease ATP-binding subunit ClpA